MCATQTVDPNEAVGGQVESNPPPAAAPLLPPRRLLLYPLPPAGAVCGRVRSDRVRVAYPRTGVCCPCAVDGLEVQGKEGTVAGRIGW